MPAVGHSWLGRVVATGLIVLAGLALAILLVAWSGVYNVAASRGHWAIVEWFLAFGMRNSVETRALAVAVPPLDDADLVRLGAGHFHTGCAPCHGAPGIPISPIAARMLPSPPVLSQAAQEWKDAELHWIVTHGIKYTGMPSWAAPARDDEVWAVVAFLKKLPGLDAQGYRDLAQGSARAAPRGGQALLAPAASPSEAASACARCHGAEERGPASGLVPILHGQPAEYLASALQAYAMGKRHSGIMQPVAFNLTPEEMRQLADYYAGLRVPRESVSPSAASVAVVEDGRKLLVEGNHAGGVPPCLPCHGLSALPSYPRLAGQQARYMAGQLRLWKMGLRQGTEGSAVMAPIAARMSARQIEDVSAYLATLPRDHDAEARRP